MQTTTRLFARDPDQGRLYLLAAILFIAYLCVAMPLPIIPVYATRQLGLSNSWAGFAVGAAFLATIVSRGHAGGLVDRLGPKATVARGFTLYVAGAVVSASAGWLLVTPMAALAVLVAGRICIGLGESMVGVSVITWGIGVVGPARSGKVLALVGAAMYGALAVGGPIGLMVFERLGFSAAMLASVVLPCLGLLAIIPIPGIAPHPDTERPPFAHILGRIWMHGLVICLQGVGFAAISAFFVLYFIRQQWDHAALGFTAFGAGFVLMRLFCGHLPDRLGGLPVAIGSLAVEATGQLMIWSAAGPGLALAGAFLSGLGCSMVFPAMGREVVHLVPARLRGTALGGFSAFQDLAYGLTGPLVGLLADRAGYSGVFLIGCIAAAGGLTLAIVLRYSARGLLAPRPVEETPNNGR